VSVRAPGAEALRRRCPSGHNCSRSTHDGLQVMRHALLGYLAAIAIGSMSQFVRVVFPDLSWLSSALFFLAFLIAFLATLSFARDKGWFGGAAVYLRRRSPQVSAERMPSDDRSYRQAAPRAQAPRPAGPAGPVPVLQKRPKDATSDPIVTTGVPGPRPEKPSDE
jgi:hypothetical protein